jgi:quercetin dioxygenase-like cupin family protein
MKRKQFIQSAAISVGALSICSITNALDNQKVLKQSKTNSEPKIIKNGEGDRQIVLGDNQILKLTGEDTNGLYTLIEQFNDPGMKIPLHIHKDEDELFHVLEGELEIQIGEEIKLLKAGDIGFCPRGIPHSWKVTGNDKAKVMLSIFPAGLENMFQELAEFPPGPPDFQKVAEIGKKYNIKFV